MRLIKFLILVLINVSFYFVLANEAKAAYVSEPTKTYSSLSSIPPTCPDPNACNDQPAPADTCWNNAVVGSFNSCGPSCTDPTTQQWSQYKAYKINNTLTCVSDPAAQPPLGFDGVCSWAIYNFSFACSTADKYNGSPAFPGGDTTELRAGDCACNPGGIYKTCCNNGSVAQSAIVDGNPAQPDAGCGGATPVVCGVPDCSIYISQGVQCTTGPCGQTACVTATPTPTPAGCSGAPTGPGPGTVPGICDPAATSCTVPCTKTCTDNSGQTCAVTGQSVWACQGGTQWFNDGTCYASCPVSCNAPPCQGNQTRTTCGGACTLPRP